MSVSVTTLSWWFLRGKQKDPKLQNGNSMNPNSELNSRESDTYKLPLTVGSNNIASKSRRLKKKLDTRQELKIDREHDVVLVPSDGGCVSDSDSDASDWSIGWSEPHGPDFLSDDETDGGFGVLVPCYGPKHRDAKEGTNKVVEMKANASEFYLTDNKKYTKQWLYSLQTS